MISPSCFVSMDIVRCGYASTLHFTQVFSPFHELNVEGFEQACFVSGVGANAFTHSCITLLFIIALLYSFVRAYVSVYNLFSWSNVRWYFQVPLSENSRSLEQASPDYELRAGSGPPYTLIWRANVLQYSLSELITEQYKLCRVVKNKPHADDNVRHCWLV
jgi:hypothetical protein